MAKLSVISYNCKGFNVIKVLCIKILLDRCSVLLLQETWLFSNQFTQFTKYFDKYKSINICGMDESIFCHGRPHGGCSILYSNQYDVTLYILRKKEELLVLKYIYVTGYFIFLTYICRVMIIQLMLMICIAMFLTPCHCIVPIIMLTLMFWVEIFNTALNRETSRRTIALNKFVYAEYLYYCCLDASSNVLYTFVVLLVLNH